MRYLSVCSGIEAATVAWHPLGWEPAAFSEIEKFPRAVLEHHYPEVPLHGDFTTIGADEYGAIDLLVGGTPCQSFSIAGLRGGLADDRGNLALEFLRLAQRTRPEWLVWENVPGVLSSNGGRDFGAILGGMAELGYGFAYRVLDAQFFGVPQRRRRVFVVGHLGDWRRAAAVLFERESLQGNPAPRRETGQVAPTIPSRSLGGGGLGTDFECDGGLIPADVDGVVGALCRQDHGGVDTQTALGGYQIPATSHSLRGEGFDASEDGTGRGTPLVPVQQAYSIMPMNSGKDYKARATDVSQPLMAGGPVGGNQGGDVIAIQERAVSENPNAGPQGKGWQEDTAFTLEARNKVRAVAFSAKDYGADAMVDCSPTLRAGGHSKSHANAGVMPAVAFMENQRGEVRTSDAANLTVGGGKPGQGYPAVLTAQAFGVDGGDIGHCLRSGASMADKTDSTTYVAQSAVRRLTPRECERLQGFPDDYTQIPWRGKGAADCPDGPRYKALGNSMAVPVMRWIGERIDRVDALMREISDAA